MDYIQIPFQKHFITIEDLKVNYYTSPLLNKFKFIHAYFTKISHEFDLELLSNGLQLKKKTTN